MAHGVGVALAGISIELWAIMMTVVGMGGMGAFMAGTIGMGIALVGGLMAEAGWSERSVPSTAQNLRV